MVSCGDCPTPTPCPPSHPCTCIGVGTIVTSPKPCPTPGNCLVLCDIVVTPMNGVGPCGQSGTIDVADTDVYNHKFDACEDNPVRWSIVNIEGDAIATASITMAGVLTWITGNASTVGKIGTITLKACCGMLSAYMQVLIGVKDLCNCPDCENCETCDPCTGECLEVDINISAGSLTTPSNLIANGS